MRNPLQALRRMLTRSASAPIILMYHRVADPPVDPWGLAVHPDRFEQQLAVLRRRRRPFPMSEFVDRLARGTLPHNAVAITFDDGYVDNLMDARPRLAAAGIPATLFLATGFVDRRDEYWWDELARGVLLHAGRADTAVEIGPETVPVTFSDRDERDQSWRAWQQPQTGRQAAYMSLWTRLRTAAASERERAMARLRSTLDIPPARAADLPMTATQVAAWTADDLFELGGHTVTHPVLPALSPPERRREIAGGRAACERLIGRPVEGFAYPHGAFDDDSQEAVKESGFRWACSTRSHAVGPDVNRFVLPRLPVLDWDGETFERILGDTRA